MKTLITLFPVLLLCCCSSEEERKVHHPHGPSIIINDPYASVWRELGAYDGNKSEYNTLSRHFGLGELDRNRTTVYRDWLIRDKRPEVVPEFSELVEVGDRLKFLPIDWNYIDELDIDIAEALTGSVTITRLLVSRDFRLVVIETENDKGEVHTYYTRIITRRDHERELRKHE